MTKTLGIDLGNGKVKLSYVDGTARGPKTVKWSSYPLSYTNDRRSDFHVGLEDALRAFKSEHRLDARSVDAIGIASSNGYSFDTFAEGARVNVEIARAVFKKREVFFVDAGGALLDPTAVERLPDRQMTRLAGTNFYGGAYLGTKLVGDGDGVSIDVGTTSTEVVPIVRGKLDPVAVKDPVGYGAHRYAARKLIWIGTAATPLHYVTPTVPLRGVDWPLTARSVTTDNVSVILDVIESNQLLVHAYEGQIPTAYGAMKRIVQALGLDQTMVTKKEIVTTARAVFDAMLDRIGDAVLRNVPKGAARRTRAAVHGLARDGVARPALARIGFRAENVVALTFQEREGLYTAASAYGLALRLLEEKEGTIDAAPFLFANPKKKS